MLCWTNGGLPTDTKCLLAGDKGSQLAPVMTIGRLCDWKMEKRLLLFGHASLTWLEL